MIGRAERAALWTAAMVLGVASFALPMVHGGPAGSWQRLAAAVGLVAIAVSPWRSGEVVAAGALATSVALAMVDTSFPLPSVALAGVTGLATFEAMSLLRVWSGPGRCAWRAEALHVGAAGRRCAIGAAAAAGVLLLGAVALPSPGVIVTFGLVAAATVVVVSTRRAG